MRLHPKRKLKIKLDNERGCVKVEPVIEKPLQRAKDNMHKQTPDASTLGSWLSAPRRMVFPSARVGASFFISGMVIYAEVNPHLIVKRVT